MTEYECVPLCGADKAHGGRAPYWKHSTMCPARNREAEESGGRRGVEGVLEDHR